MDDRCCTKRREAAVCGHYCGTCDRLREGTCCGCGYQLGETSNGECPVFQCCIVERGLAHCGLCLDFPCQLFLGHAPPLDVARRYQALCRRAEIGTTAWLEEQEETN